MLQEIRPALDTLGVILRTLAGVARQRLQRMVSLRGPRPLRVGIDIRPFYEPLTGVGWYLYELICELSRRDDVALVLLGDARLTDAGPHLHVELPRGLTPAAFDLRGRPQSPLARAMAAGAYLVWIELEDCDVIFGANYFLPRLMSAIARRRVITVHDLTFRHFPELLQEETLENLRREMPREVQRAEAVICVSESTRQDLLTAYSMDPHRAVTIHSGIRVDPDEARHVERLPDRYLLFVSTIEPRKNLGILLKAWERLRDRGVYPGGLVIAGRVGWKAESLMKSLRSSRWSSEIVHLDYLDREGLLDVYRRAEIFVLPSFYEGFGFPLLEAMACGVPAIAARTSSLPEVGSDAALYFDPTNPEELEATLERLLHDSKLRRELIERGLSRAAEFNWEACADRTLALFQRVAEHR